MQHNDYTRCQVRHQAIHLIIILCTLITDAATTSAAVGTEDNPIHYSILEEQEANSINIGDVAVDSGLQNRYPAQVLRKLKYSFLRNPTIGGMQRFEINANSGIIRTTSRLDRDSMCFGEEDCVVRLDVAVGPAKYFQIIYVSVEVLDVNDNYPEFNVEKINIEIPENTGVGADFDLPTAEDIDNGMFAIQRYGLQNGFSHFRLQEVPAAFDDTIELKLILTKELDREKVDNYRLVISAYDGATPALSGELVVNVTVSDSNDNAPVFSNETYTINVPEDFHVNNTLVTVTATDADLGPKGKVVYSFNSKTQRKYASMFTLRPRTGELILKRAFDYQQENSFHLVVVASDQGARPKSSYTIVQINVQDVNNHYPQFVVNTLMNSGEAQISEGVAKGTFVAHISVTDADYEENAHVECTIDSNDFALRKLSSTQYKLITRSHFDRETQDFYQVAMTCTDSGKPPLRTVKDISVQILDENDYEPKFTQAYYVANLKENNLPGTHVVTVSANDMDIGPNGNLTYYIENRWTNHFQINSDTGEITATASLDHEEIRQVDMTVGVHDRGNPPKSASITVLVNIIDLNDESPKFSQDSYSFGVFENNISDSDVGFVYATDRDSDPYNQVVYSIVEEDVPGMFSVNSETGLIQTRGKLDRETRSSYRIILCAQNPTYPIMSSTVEATIHVADVNDNPPVLQFPNDINNTIWISNRVPRTFTIAKIRATDEDDNRNARLVYRLLGSVDNSWFELDPFTGNLKTLKKLEQFDDELFQLDILVSDEGENEMSTSGVLYVHVNSSVEFYLPEEYKNSGLMSDPNTLALIAVGASAGFILVVLFISLAIVKRQSAARRSHTYKCRPSESQRMLKCAPGDPHGQDAWKERPPENAPEILFKVIDTKPNGFPGDDYSAITPTSTTPNDVKSTQDSPMHQIKPQCDKSETYQDRTYINMPHPPNTSSYRPKTDTSNSYRPPRDASDLYQPLVHGDQRVTQPCDPAVEELRLLEYLKHISDDEYGESEGESNPDSGRGASEEGDQGTDNGKNGTNARRSPSKCGAEGVKTRAGVTNGMSTFMPQQSPKNGRLTPAAASSSPSPNGSSVSPVSSTCAGSHGPTSNTQPVVQTAKKSRPVCPRPPSSTYQSLKDMAMYVDDDDDVIDTSAIDGCIPIVNGSTGISKKTSPDSLVGVDTNLCYTDSMDVKHSIV